MARQTVDPPSRKGASAFAGLRRDKSARRAEDGKTFNAQLLTLKAGAGRRSKGQAISSYDLAADLPAALGSDPAGDG